MTITLSPLAEKLLREHLARGEGQSPEEIIEQALRTLKGGKPNNRGSKKSPAEVVADILELRRGVTLGGLKIKDLIHEGHKY